MPKYNVILNLPGFTIQKVSGYQPLLFELTYDRIARCARCNSKTVRKKDSYMRTVHHELIGHRRKHQRSTERLQGQIYHQHMSGVSQKDLSVQFKQGKATIERWYQRRYRLENKELSHTPCPIVLGIDEHSFSRKQGFSTTLCDLRKHKVFDIVKGRSEPDLAGLHHLRGHFNQVSLH